MENITMTQANKEIKVLKSIFDYSHRRMTEEKRDALRELGYEYRELGCGKSVYTHSGSISILKPDKSYRGRHPEKMLAVGLCNYAKGKYSVYFAFVKKIIN